MSKITEISFVCLGNICRSPLAQGVFQDLVNREKLDQKIFISSAGTGNWHIGNLPDERMRQTAQSKGIKLESRAQQFQSKDFNRFNLVLAMDHSNLVRLSEIAPSTLPKNKLMLFRSFDPESTKTKMFLTPTMEVQRDSRKSILWLNVPARRYWIISSLVF